MCLHLMLLDIMRDGGTVMELERMRFDFDCNFNDFEGIAAFLKNLCDLENLGTIDNFAIFLPGP